MNADLINQTCQLLPSPDEDVVRDSFRLRAVDTSLGIEDKEISRYMGAYKDLQYGWNFARTMALNRRHVPMHFKNRDDWVHRAYMYCVNPERYRDPHLVKALGLMARNCAKERSVLNALLVSSDMDMTKIAKITNYHINVVAAYENLFFNVFDRREDDMFLSSIIYPEGRLVEYFHDYATSEALDVQLLRAGFNHGAPLVLHLSGFPTALVRQYLSSDAPSRLESMFMANALMMADMGWLNQGSALGTGMQSATRMLTAAKAGGQSDAQSPFQGRQSGGQVMLAEMQRVKGAQMQARRFAFHQKNPQEIKNLIGAAGPN